eukprot:5829423-Ditylum_brightwellii.AAC.1
MKEATAKTTSPFSLDLLPLSKSHREFLKTLHGLGITQSVPSSKSVRRYLDLWLPLVAEYNNRCSSSLEMVDKEIGASGVEL